MRRQLVFGYGSLPAEETGIECCLHDHRRHWGVAMDNRETVPGYKGMSIPAAASARRSRSPT